MKTNVIMAIMLILSSLEVFMNVFTKIFHKIDNKLRQKKQGEKQEHVKFKLFWIAVLLTSAVYFMFKLVYLLARVFGIPLDKSIIDLLVIFL